ncbi:hypothetical protein ABES02_28580 [Neobacillus pocheonensis]|uniref:hypothetical protein n=1 Tax=Neobacillus pocheonensis TaxID=363869 RepID=UPI003D2D922C
MTMEIYVHALKVNKEGVHDIAPIAPFKENPLLGIYSEEQAYFKLDSAMNKLFTALGVKLSDYFTEDRYGVVFNIRQVMELYARLYREKEALRQRLAGMSDAEIKQYNEQHFAPDETVDAVLHFLGICLANQYPVSLH